MSKDTLLLLGALAFLLLAVTLTFIFTPSVNDIQIPDRYETRVSISPGPLMTSVATPSATAVTTPPMLPQQQELSLNELLNVVLVNVIVISAIAAFLVFLITIRGTAIEYIEDTLNVIRYLVTVQGVRRTYIFSLLVSSGGGRWPLRNEVLLCGAL